MLRQSGDAEPPHEAERSSAMRSKSTRRFARAHAGLCRGRTPRLRADEAIARTCRRPRHACRAALDARSSAERRPRRPWASCTCRAGGLEQAETVYRSLLAGHRPTPMGTSASAGHSARSDARRRPRASFRAAVTSNPAYWRAYSGLGAFLFSVGSATRRSTRSERVTELAPGNRIGVQQPRRRAADGRATCRRPWRVRAVAAIEPSRSAYSNLGTL